MPNAETLITENLETWSAAIKVKSSTGRGGGKKEELYGIKKLRELILDLAVRGLLVPQDPNDEPASELLKIVATQRAALIKAGKLPRQKAQPTILADELVFKAPVGWTFVRFGDIFTLEYGNNLPAPKRSGTGEYPVFGSNGIVGSHNESCVNQPCIVVGRKGSAGALNLCLDNGCWVTDVAYSVVPPSGLYLGFVFLHFHTLGLDSLGKGIKPGLSRNEAYKLIVGIPPLAEQHRIVAKVDELMGLCDQLEQQQEDSMRTHQTLVQTLLGALTAASERGQFEEAWKRIESNFDTLFTSESSIDELKQTLLQLAVMGKLVPQDPGDEPVLDLLKKITVKRADLIKAGTLKKRKVLAKPPISSEPSKLPPHWEWCYLDSLITEMDAGWSPACPPSPSPSNDIWGVLKTTAVQIMEYREAENKVLDKAKEPRPRYEVRAGDILITRAGPKNRVGISCLVEHTRPRLMISDKIIRFHLIEVGMADRYISLCLNAGATRSYLEDSKSGMASSQMNISQGKLKMAPIPLPPLAEQHRIVAKVDELMDLCDALKAKLKAAQTTQLTLADTLANQAL